MLSPTLATPSPFTNTVLLPSSCVPPWESPSPTLCTGAPFTKTSGLPMAFVTVEDIYGTVEVIVFSKLYEQHGAGITENRVVIVDGTVSLREDEEQAKIIADNLRFIAGTGM